MIWRQYGANGANGANVWRQWRQWRQQNMAPEVQRRTRYVSSDRSTSPKHGFWGKVATTVVQSESALSKTAKFGQSAVTVVPLRRTLQKHYKSLVKS